MLERYSLSIRRADRLRASPVGGVIDLFVGDMHDRGHSDRTIDGYVREIECFGRWLKRKRRTVEVLNKSTMQEYLNSGQRRSKPKRSPSAALSRLLATVRAHGIVPLEPTSEVGAVDVLVNEFLEHLKCVRGLRAATCQQRQYYVREFLDARFSAGAPEVEKINAGDVIAFVTRRAEGGHTRAAKCAATSLRAFLGFLVVRGRCAKELVDAVPTVAHRAVRLPGHLSDDQVGRLLASFDRTRSVGRRDHAIALCLVRLGLRVGEVVSLKLDDFSWRDGTVRVGSGKSRRPAVLPLSKDVGHAISEYIRQDRRIQTGRYVFVTHSVPLNLPMNASAARAAIRRAFDRAGLKVPSKGTHILRHTIATNLVSHGSSLKEVADVLRHRSLDTTKIYASVDLLALGSVAMPWPEVGL